MYYKEKFGNLFNLGDKYTYVQCISMDLKMGAGIAVQFNRHFDVKSKLLDLYPNGYERIGCIKCDNVLNLVTKERYYDKPTMDSLQTALLDMRRIIIRDNIKSIAMPQIGCGLDGLKWCNVSKYIYSMFNDLDICIIVMIQPKR